MRHITQHCTVDAEDGVVFLECEHASLTLDPGVAEAAGDRLMHHAGVARAQRQLPTGENESGEDG